MSDNNEKKIIPLEEIAKHNKPDDIWFAINGKVYDVTSFLSQHPGGEEVLLEYAGGDATEPYEDVGHSETATSYLKDLYIGEGNPEELKVNAKKRNDHIDDDSETSASTKMVYFFIISVVVAFFYFKHKA